MSDSTSTYGTTLLQLRNMVRQRCLMSGSTGPDQSVPDLELNSYINGSYSEFQGVIVRLNERNYLTSSNFSLPSNQVPNNFSALPTNFAVIAGVERSLDNSGSENTWVSIPKFEFNDRNFGNNAMWPVAAPNAAGIKYGLYDWNIVVQPALASGGLYRIWYYPQAPLLVNDSDTFDDQRQWYEFVVVDACIKVCASRAETELVQTFAAQKQNMLERIRSTGGDRDVGMAKRYGRSGTGRGWGSGNNGGAYGFGGGDW